MNNNKKPGEPLEPERWAKIEKEVQELKRSRSILSIGLFLLSGLYGILILCIILRIIRIEDTLTSIIQFNALVGEHLQSLGDSLIRMNEFLKVALTACIPAMTVIFGWGLNKGVSIANGYINNKFEQTCLQNAANAVFNAVQYVNQTYVDALKEQDKFDEAAQRIAYNRALTAAKKALTQETIKFIKETFGDLDSYLKPMIEAQVRSQKTYM